MSVAGEGVRRAGLIVRVRDVLVHPSRVWDEIAYEPSTIGGLYAAYVVPLAAIAAACSATGLLIFGVNILGVTIRPPVMVTLGEAVAGFLVTLLGVFVLALVIDGLAATFHGVPNRTQAFKLAAYSGTAAWVANILALWPILSMAAGFLGALYGLYVLYRGLPKLMRSPDDRTLPYFAVVILTVILLALVVAGVEQAVRKLGGPLGVSHQETASITLPGKATFDLNRIDEAENAVKALKSETGAAPVDPEVLKASLPESLGGVNRSDLGGSETSTAGVKGASAKATYGKGSGAIHLSITDVGQAGGLAGLASSLHIKSSQGSADHYQKIGKVDGRMTQEKFDRPSRTGSYGVLVASKFMVEARGSGVEIAALKDAVHAVDFTKLEGLAGGQPEETDQASPR